MKKSGLIFLLMGAACAGRSQAVFQSGGGGSGNWNDPASWTLISGISSGNYPVSGDSVTITGGAIITVDVAAQCNAVTITASGTLQFNSTASILTVSNSLNMSATSKLDLTLGVLTVTGNCTVGGASTITINQGVMTVVGIFQLNCPTPPSAPGTTLLDVEGGAFSCVGAMVITGTTSTRIAELRIGNGAVNLVGGVATATANAHINFTGTGTLTLAGVVTMTNTASFIAGNGRVVYVGIPGSNQTVAPLTYYRLMITGIGSGLKQINGAVAVTDSLTLLTDTLEIDAGGSLTLSDGITVVRTAGHLLSAPAYAGTVNLLYNDILRDTTGPELPVSITALQQLTVSDISGIVLNANATVNNNLSLQTGPLITGQYTLTLTNAAGGTGTDPGVTVANGYVEGALTRSIGASPGLRIFPLGIDNQGYREFDVDYTTAPASGGQLTAWAIDSSAPGQSGLPLIDNAITITHTAPVYWEADAGGGLSGGLYTVTLTGQGVPGVSDLSTLRIVKRPSSGGDWILDGTDGSHTGNTAEPVVSRTGMSGFSQFSLGSDNSNTLPITLLSFAGQTQGSKVLLRWVTTQESNNLYFSIEHSMDGQIFSTLGTVIGSATTNLEQTYTYTQNPAPIGTNYYRLKQTDADGRSTYSQIVVCQVTGVASLSLYPNPAGSTLNITTTTNGPLALLDARGHLVGTLKVGSNDIDSLAAGVYYVRLGGQLYPFVKR
jgi:hypothetical protein